MVNFNHQKNTTKMKICHYISSRSAKFESDDLKAIRKLQPKPQSSMYPQDGQNLSLITVSTDPCAEKY